MPYVKGVLKMDVLVTPDVIDKLKLISTTLVDNVNRKVVLLSFTESYVFFILKEEPFLYENIYEVEFITESENILLSINFNSIIKTSSKHWVLKYEYSFIINSLFKQQWNTLLIIKEYEQLRKDVRIPLSAKNIEVLGIQSIEAYLWIKQEKRTCILHNISFSGIRFFTTERVDLEVEEKALLTIIFNKPSEIASLRCVIVRCMDIHLKDINCFDIAVKLLEPVDILYLQRLAEYFKKENNREVIELASCEAN